MTATIDEIQAGIKRRLETIVGLHAYATEPDDGGVLPAAHPRLVDWVYDETTHGEGEDIETTYRFDIWVLVSMAAGLGRAQAMLNPYLSVKGSRSIKLAIEEDYTLSGTAHSSRLIGGGAYGQTTAGTVPVLAGSMRLEVFA